MQDEICPHCGAKKKQGAKGLAEKPDDVSQQVWDDFLLVRKAKKAPFTQTALTSTIREAGKAGMTTEEALAMCQRRGWQGFESRYVQELNGGIDREREKINRLKLTTRQVLEGLTDD